LKVTTVSITSVMFVKLLCIKNVIKVIWEPKTIRNAVLVGIRSVGSLFEYRSSDAGMYWCVPVCTGVYRYVLVCTGMYWCVPVCTGVYWYVLSNY